MKLKDNFRTMLLGAIGVVYGDIGTSPLYALKSCFMISSLPVSEINILGIISLFIWTLFLMATIKYVYLVLTVNSQGEGGILVLALLCSKLRLKKYKAIPVALGMVGAALLLGDGVITPAISVLSALEGLHLIAPLLATKHIMFISIIVLLLLFLLQKRGSEIIGNYFGPVMVIWFMALAILGMYNIFYSPTILRALNPYYALYFLSSSGMAGFVALGGTILVITGAEALYADLGHFGKKPIQVAWTYFVFPSLILNYLGQGGLLLHNPEAISNTLYNLAPHVVLYPLIALATLSTIIASQAIISGVFSLTWQAVMLGYLPRLKVIHTSSHMGQIYVPVVNAMLCILTIGAVIHFESSEHLAVAYGLSVAGVMFITTILLFYIAMHKWKWSPFKCGVILLPFLLLDFNFVMTNIVKIVEGAWYTLTITAAVTYTMWVWKTGNRKLIGQKIISHGNISSYLLSYKKNYKERIPGCAIFMSHFPNKVPNALVVHLRHNKFLHEKVIILSVLTKPVPRVAKSEKFFFEEIDKNIFAITASFGFQEVPSLHDVTTWAYDGGIIPQDTAVSCFLSKDVPVASRENILDRVSEKLYIFLSNNALPAYDFFKVPNQKIIELVVKYKV